MRKQSPNLADEIRAGRIRDDMTFSQKVWAMTARVPQGRLTTYGEIARALGCKGARAVGNALNKNPYAPQVPCHRVVGSKGDLTGFAGGLALKRKMLADEGIVLKDDRAALEDVYKFPLGRDARR